MVTIQIVTDMWHDGVSNHRNYDCLSNRLFRRRSKKTSKLRVTGLCEGNQPVTGEFPAQRASNGEEVSIWWRHHVQVNFTYTLQVHFSWHWCHHTTDQFHKSQNAPVPYPTMVHSEQKCAHFCSEWSIVGHGQVHSGIYELGQLSQCWWSNTEQYIMTSSHGNIFPLLAFSAGNSPDTGESPSQRPVTQFFDVFFDLRLDKRLSKQSWGWWFETPSRPSWRQCYDG